MNYIKQAIKRAKNPTPIYCSECGEDLYSPMDKLSVSLYDKCVLHLEDNGHEEKNLLKISESL